MWRLMCSLVLVSLMRINASPIAERAFTIYETPEYIMSLGYPAERHHVTTEDGYILEMHRIPRGRDEVGTTTQDRPVVFLMHGLMGSSNTYIAVGPANGVAFNLADAGFDVWMGNARGTRNSRNNTRLNPDDEVEKFAFFNFSFEEIGVTDIAAMIDYALAVTRKTSLHYIGHSQGGTTFLVLASMKPNYNIRFKSVHLLAGVGYQNYFPDTQLAQMAQLTDMIYEMSLSNGIVEVTQDINEIMPNSLNNSTSNINICTGNPVFNVICNMLGVNRIFTRRDNDTNTTLYVGGASVKQIAHFGQNIRDRAFRRWNYGAAQNLQIYGVQDPPAYNLALITANVTMHYTLADNLLDERDVLAMAAAMPRTQVRKVGRDTFEHGDFMVAPDNKALVTDYIINEILCDEALPGCDRSGASNIVLSALLKVSFIVFSLRTIIIFF